jgi:hypothetical protein
MSEEKNKTSNRVDKFMRFESGEMDGNEILEFFSELIRDGLCWHLQGVYGRTASNLINTGFIDEKGNIRRRFEEDEG